MSPGRGTRAQPERARASEDETPGGACSDVPHPYDRRANGAKRSATGWPRAGLMRFPGAFNPLSALLIERLGFEGVYVSGAVHLRLAGLPDIGLTTLSEVAARGHEIARTTGLPTLMDADTGFGEPLNAARTVQVLEELGLAGCHIEDQVNPKRCGHLDGKEVVPADEMRRRIRAAAGARRDAGLSFAHGRMLAPSRAFNGAIERAKSYLDAGADMIFPEALEDADRVREVQAGGRRPCPCQYDRVRQD